jgi:Asp-tRNA(Asn)/Glu-tRNA(Gln) amidotransferase A subunit family amidase
MIPLALGTQTGGSVIRPASFCGVIGVKPSHGLIPRTGVMMHSAKLDHLGVFARTLEDAALLLDAVAGYDAGDPDTRPVASPNFAAALTGSPHGKPRLAFVRTPMWNKADAEARAALEGFVAKLGDRVTAVDLPDWFAAGWEAQRIVMAADMAHVHGASVDANPDKASAALREMVAEGRKIPAVQYFAAMDLARRMTAALTDILGGYDAIITLAAPGIAPKDLGFTGDPVFNALWTFTGLPAVTLPLLKGGGGLPIGVQLVGAPSADARLLRTAASLQAAVG